jgi:hypothetical protein
MLWVEDRQLPHVNREERFKLLFSSVLVRLNSLPQTSQSDVR